MTTADPPREATAAPVGAEADAWQLRADVRRAQRRAVRVLVAAQVLGGVGLGAAASIGSPLAEAVTHSEAWAGVARSASTLGAALFALPLALFALRRGRRRALGFGWLVSGAGAGLLVTAALSGNLLLLLVGMLLFGAGSATNLQSRFAAADLAEPQHRARALSLVVWSTTVGSVVGPNLAEPGAALSRVFGWPHLAGGFLIAAAFLVPGAVLIAVALRPDPLLLARSHETRREARAETVAEATAAGRVRVREVLRWIWSVPAARFAFVAVVLGHTVMGAVMTMTPVHMIGAGMSLTFVGITISGHVIGMYGFAPVIGWLSDRFGRVTVIVAAQAVFVASAALAGPSGNSMALVTAGLFLLGLGWSMSLVAGSAMLTDAAPARFAPAVQGATDTTMNVAAALAAGLSGPVLAGMGFGGLNVLAAVLVIPVLLLLLGRLTPA